MSKFLKGVIAALIIGCLAFNIEVQAASSPKNDVPTSTSSVHQKKHKMHKKHKKHHHKKHHKARKPAAGKM